MRTKQTGSQGVKSEAPDGQVEGFKNVIPFQAKEINHMANATAAVVNTQEECLRDAICVIDGLAQEGFSQIAAIASLALLSMEVPDAFHLRTDLAYALSAIRGKAQDIENCINSEAKKVGCIYVDERRSGRLKAQVEGWRGRAV